MDKKKYRWVICAGCTLMFFCTAGLGMTGFTVYQPYLISEGGLTNAQASLLTSVRSMFTFLTMFGVGRILNKTDIRLGGTLSVMGIGLALFLYGLADSFPVYVLAAAIAGACYGTGGMLAVSVMIHRWFEEHEALAVGICSAGSGFSAVVGTPVITWMIGKFSMKRTFYIEAVFVMAMAVLVFVMLRNRPRGEERPPQFVPKKQQGSTTVEMFRAEKKEQLYIMTGVLFMGFTYASSSHISVLYRTAGYAAGQVSFLVALMGAALFIGKCAYGETADKIGSYLAGNLFFGMLIAGGALCCLADRKNFPVAVVAVALLSGGSVLLSVGLTVIAGAVAKKEYYAVVVRKLQIVYLFGSMVFGVVPGIIADHMESYVLAYLIMTGFAAAAAMLVQPVLRRHES